MQPQPRTRLICRYPATSVILVCWVVFVEGFMAGKHPGSSPINWPSFRGPQASGVAMNQDLPDRWNGLKGVNIRWKTYISGLAHSSPIVWGERIYLTTAVSSLGDGSFRHGLYGIGDNV